MLNRKNIHWLGIVLMMLTVSIVGLGSPAYADSGNDSVVDKILLQGLAQCYDNGVFVSEISLSDVSGVKSILNSNASTKNINIPNGLVGSFTGDRVSCKELMTGVSTWFSGSSSGILKDKTVIPSSWSTDEEKEKFLEDMGYIGSGRSCFKYKYEENTTTNSSIPSSNTSSESTEYTHHLCAVVDSDGNIASELSVEKDGNSDIVEFELTDNNSAVQLDCATLNFLSKGGCSKHDGAIGTNWESFRQSIFEDLANNRISFDTKIDTSNEYFTNIEEHTYQLSKDADVENDTDAMDYKLDTTNAKSTMLKAFTGSSTVPYLSTDDTAQLYITYLKDYYGGEQACGDFNDNQKTVYEADGYLQYRDDANGNMCYVRATKNENEKVNGVSNGKLNYQGDDFENIVNWLKSYTGSVDVNLDTATTLDPEQTTTGETESGDSTTEDTCAGTSAAASLGWIVCPILEWMGDASESLYDTLLEPALQVDAQLFTGSGESTQLSGWEVFRNIANVAFIIALIVVIFSQLTGVGIDNYGIKKILPKMIVAAILINLSYWICVALVDVSNIVGNGLQAMFDSMPANTYIDSNGALATGSSASSGGLATTLVLVGLVGAGVVVWSNPAILLSLLVSAIGVLISMFFLFIMLAARQAAIVVLIVISPLAIVCFMLPNTKGYFDKWWKFLGSLLMVYPITGLLVGGGNYVSRLLLTNTEYSSNFFASFTAMIVGIVPIFFIPTVLKKSLAMAGDIGNKISGVGSRFGGRVKKEVRESEGYKQARMNMNAGVNGGLRERVAMKTGIGRKSMMRARAAKIQDAAAEEKAKSLVGGTGYDAALKRIESEARNQEVENEIKLMADGKNGTNNYDVDTMNNQLIELLDKDSLTDGEKVRMKALMSKLATGSGYGKKKLATTAAGASSGTKAEVAKYMSKNSDVSAAISAKDNARGQYLREVNSGQVSADTDFETWAGAQRKGYDGTNMDFVMNKVITDDRDFVTQSASAVKEQLPSLSNDRLTDMVNNERLMDGIDSDVRKELREAASSRGINVPDRVSSGVESANIAGGTRADAGQGEVFNVRQAEQNAQAAADEIDFVSHLSTVSDNGLNNLYENTDFRSTLSDAANQALESEYNRRTTPSSSSTPRTTPRTNSNSTTNPTPPRPNA